MQGIEQYVPCGRRCRLFGLLKCCFARRAEQLTGNKAKPAAKHQFFHGAGQASSTIKVMQMQFQHKRLQCCLLTAQGSQPMLTAAAASTSLYLCAVDGCANHIGHQVGPSARHRCR